jgi:hypothetical protein
LPLTRPTRSVVHRLRLVLLIVTLLSLFAVDLARPEPGLAKEFDVVGTVDCGIPSGRHCELGDTLVLLTDSVSGLMELVAFDIRGIKRKLPDLDQDDEITLCVELLPDGKLKAQCVISTKKREGTLSQGSSTGSREVTESRRDRGLGQDNDDTIVANARGGVVGVVVNQLTGAPIPGATVRLNGFAVVTDANGRFSILLNVDPGTRLIEASAPLFVPSAQPVVVQSAQTTAVTIPLTPLPGVVTGIVRSLLTGGAIPGATVVVNGFTATTDAGGAFNIAGVPPGTYQATASAPGFISQTQPVTVLATQATPLTFLLPTAFANLNFTLVWGAQPPDFDAHLSGPGTLVNGFGPERITVTRNPATQQYVAGEYRFWADNPERAIGGPGYTGSGVRVIVNLDAQLLGIFDVANAAGNPNDRLWHAVNVTLDAAGNATVVPVQQFTNGDASTVLAVPPGAKPPRR